MLFVSFSSLSLFLGCWNPWCRAFTIISGNKEVSQSFKVRDRKLGQKLFDRQIVKGSSSVSFAFRTRHSQAPARAHLLAHIASRIISGAENSFDDNVYIVSSSHQIATCRDRVASRQSQTALIINCHSHRNVTIPFWSIQFPETVEMRIDSFWIVRICIYFNRRETTTTTTTTTAIHCPINCNLSIKYTCVTLIVFWNFETHSASKKYGEKIQVKDQWNWYNLGSSKKQWQKRRIRYVNWLPKLKTHVF